MTWILTSQAKLRQGRTGRTTHIPSIRSKFSFGSDCRRAIETLAAFEKPESKRCTAAGGLEYADHLSFHMDIVPCIPEEQTYAKA